MRCRSAERLACALLTLAVGCGGQPDPAGEPPLAARAPEEPAPVADLVRAEGDVRWLPRGAGQWRPAAAVSPLRVAEQVQTMSASAATVRLRADGATIDLGPASLLRVPDGDVPSRRLRHVAGDLVARLEPGHGPRRLAVELPPGELILDARDAAVESRVSVHEGEATVEMVEGRARVERPGAEAVAIDEAHYVHLGGDGAILDEGAALAAPAPLGPAPGPIATRGEARFAWSEVEGAIGYRLYVAAAVGEPREVRVAEPAASVTVARGSLRWWVRAEDARGLGHPSPTREHAVTIDRSPPALRLASPSPGASVRGVVNVAGVAEPGAVVEIDGRPAEVDADGRFAARVPLPRGLANLVVRATDPAGNASVLTRALVVR